MRSWRREVRSGGLWACAVGAMLIVSSLLRAADEPAAPTPEPSTYQKQILPFLTTHCSNCHANGESQGGISFSKFTDDQSVWKDRVTWQTVQQKLHSRQMPPDSEPQPSQAEIDGALGAISGLFDRMDRAVKPSAGHVTMRRLNKTEYNNTIRDLVGVDFKPADDFPADDVGYGFDNIGDVLSISPVLLERYLSAAETILDQAIVNVDPVVPSKVTYDSLRTASISQAGELGKLVSFEAGEYIIRWRVASESTLPEPTRVALRVAGKVVQEAQVVAPLNQPIMLEARVKADAVTSRVSVELLNPSDPKDSARRVLYLKSIELEGPFNAPAPTVPESHKRIMAYDRGLSPREAARQIITRFANRAFRRPVLPEEVERCLSIFDAQEKLGERFESAIRASLYRVLVSPHFLFRVELDPPNAAQGSEHPISEYELASRLSYFLWNSMPDQELFVLAGRGQLRANLDAQVRRMTADAKSSSFLRNFAEQWLTLRKLELSSPDPKLFPTFDVSLRESMISESLLFFENMVREDRSIVDLLDANYTFVNEELARHYGISGVVGSEFVRVNLPPDRGGILTQAGILTLTSNATRTSPVKRGKFVLEQILNTPPPPPPPDVPAIEEQKELTGTMRQIMEQHRANPGCASCHQRLDPLGFAFENFDPVGVWRDKQANVPIDSSGGLPDGKTFNGPAELKHILREKRELFVRCVAEKMLTYALGRGLEAHDRNAVDAIMKSLGENNDRFSVLLLEIARSDPFQKRTVLRETK